jgi:transcriptional regulator with XRE-family HTH domain
MENPNIIAQRISELVTDSELSISEIAARTYVSQSTIVRIISGEVKKPNISTIGSLAHHFDVETDWILGRQEQRNRLTDFKQMKIQTPDYFVESVSSSQDQLRIIGIISHAFTSYYHECLNTGVIPELTAVSDCYQAERLFLALVKDIAPVNGKCPELISTAPADEMFDHSPKTFNAIIDLVLEVFDTFYRVEGDYHNFPDLYEFSSTRRALIQYLGRLLAARYASHQNKGEVVTRPIKSDTESIENL